METLDQIAIKMGTDKSSNGHSYTKHYEAYFEPLRNLPIKILEIGVQTGASLRMWKQYFPKAQIYGLDYYDCEPFIEDRIKIIQGAQIDPKVLEKVSAEGTFDVIIDDGSHKNPDILASFEYLFPRMSIGGLYIVEDLNVTYWGNTHNVGEQTVIPRFKELVDDVMARGKSGIGDPNKDQQDGEWKKRGEGRMTWWEKNIRFVHFYRSMAFIGRSELTY